MADLTPVRGQGGKFDIKPSAAIVDARCCELRTLGYSYREISEELQINVARAHSGVRKGMASVLKEPAEAALALEMNRLDRLERNWNDMLNRYRHACAMFEKWEAEEEQRRLNGEDPSQTGNPYPDPEIGTKALAGLLKVMESRRKLLGLDQPAKVQVAGSVEYTINGVDPKALT